MRIPSRILAAPLLIGIVALGAAACSDDDEEPNEVTISGGEFSFSVTEGDLEPGVNTLTFRNAGGEEHHLQLIGLAQGKTIGEFLAVFADPSAQPPDWAAPLGGVGILSGGEEASVTLNLPEGDYAFVCLIESESDGIPHAAKGMISSFTVEGDSIAAEAPAEQITIKGSDFAFDTADTFPAGETTLRFTNEGQSLHEVVLARFPAGTEIDLDALVDFFAGGEEGPPPFEAPPVFVGGVQAITPGASQLATINLERGTYVLLCGLPDEQGVPHLALGMLRQIRVE